MADKKLILFSSLIALSYIQLGWANETKIEQPAGGWRYSEKTGFMQEVHYPASTTNAGNHALANLIKGHIKQNNKGRPATLIVNGAPMPLLTDESGEFARPYAFGRGSNSVEIRSAEKSPARRVQFYEANSTLPQAKLRIVLSWDTNQTDLDLHVITPDGQHAFYGNRSLTNGGALDVDVTTGYGPEIFASPTLANGTYHIFVNYYGSGEDQSALTTARITLISQENTPHEKQQAFQIPMRSSGELTHVKSFAYP